MKRFVVLGLQVLIIFSSLVQICYVFTNPMDMNFKEDILEPYVAAHPEVKDFWEGEWQKWEQGHGHLYLNAYTWLQRVKSVLLLIFFWITFRTLRSYQRLGHFQLVSAQKLRRCGHLLIGFAAISLICAIIAGSVFPHLPFLSIAAEKWVGVAQHVDLTINTYLLNTLIIAPAVVDITIGTFNAGNALLIALICYLLAEIIRDNHKLKGTVSTLQDEVDRTI